MLPAALIVAGCGGSPRTGATHVKAPPRLAGPEFGLTEDNAQLLWRPDATAPVNPSVQAARRELSALHPGYVRLLVNWAALQPTATSAPTLDARVDGCARSVGPCAAYAGIREELAAIASQQHAARAPGQPPPFEVVIQVFGVPAWAARPASGCATSADAGPFSRPLRRAAIDDYRALIRSLAALGAHEGVALRWWSPWNEPNDPVFVSPQRTGCTVDSPPVSPAVYAELVRAMSAELQAQGGERHLLLGELNAFVTDSPHRTSIAQFVSVLPADVLCSSDVFSIHAYAVHGAGSHSSDSVRALEHALDARGVCGAHMRIWVTEAGAGAPHPGRARAASAIDQRQGCRALARQLIDWYRDPRVGAVFQYTFREDPAFPVGLAGADLSHLYQTYGMWLSYSQRRVAGSPPASPAAACA